MRWVGSIVSLIAIPFFVFTLYGAHNHQGLIEGLKRWQESKVIYRQALEDNEALRGERAQYIQMIKKLESDPLEKEQLVRAHGYIKPGEKVYRISREESESRSPNTELDLGNVEEGTQK